MKLWQNQYAFVHDAVLEALICGDTRIPASDLHQAIQRLNEANERNTGFERQFQVKIINKLTLAVQCILVAYKGLHMEQALIQEYSMGASKWVDICTLLYRTIGGGVG